MTEILKRINESGLSPNQYFLLYSLVHKLSVDHIDVDEETKVLESLGHLNDGEITSAIFELEEEERGFQWKAAKYSQLFPPIVLPTGVHARGKLHPIKVKLKAFIKAYTYDWDVIYQATEKYINRYASQGYKYMQNASNFIYDKNGDSTLALECDTLEYISSSADNESI